MIPLEVVNLEEARFECIYGRGCDGICCQNGRPGLDPEEIDRIEQHYTRIAPHLRPEARAVIDREGFMSNRFKKGQRMLRVVKGWCIFFNQGCVLHKVGATEGNPFKYKPVICALFPLNRLDGARWYVRQWGYLDEVWDLFCLAPNSKTPKAVETIQGEMALAQQVMDQEEHARKAAERKQKAKSQKKPGRDKPRVSA